MSTDMIIISYKTAYYNNAHGEIHFPEVGYITICGVQARHQNQPFPDLRIKH